MRAQLKDAPFGMVGATPEPSRLVDDRIDPTTLLFTLYVLADELVSIPLTEDHRFAEFDGLTLSVINDSLFVNGSALPEGVHEVGGRKVLVVDARGAQTTHMLLDDDNHFVLGASRVAGVRTRAGGLVIVHGDTLTVHPGESFLYLNDRPITQSGLVGTLETGDRVLTAEYLLERRPSQWRVTTFTDQAVLDYSAFLQQEKAAEFPPDFPEYRRSPRVTLEVPTDKVQIEKIGAPQKPDKNSILKALVPPLGMVAVGVAMSVLSGRNPLMMLGMGLMSIVTATFTLTQFVADRRERRAQDDARRDDYERYLLNVAADLTRLSEQEQRVREYALPGPAALVRMVTEYDSRIYERLPNNKDFLEVSLGTGDAPSSLTVTSTIDVRDDDEDARRVKELVARFATQRQAPVPLNLRAQTLGLVGTYNVVRPAAANLLFQLAVFHSYRDVEFIVLAPEKSYRSDWFPWRFLPHLTMQGLNVRGLVHNAKTRDMILTSFTQILTKRRQALTQAGREKPVFGPHYVFTVFDDSYLAGHGINEFLAEDLSELGVTVVWCKEDRKLLPETVTALIEYKNRNAATLVNDKGIHVARDFVPSQTPDGLERALRRLSNLNHVEVEKNAIPKAVTFLEMYTVKAVEDLEIGQRWAAADTSKTLAVPLGLRGKDDLVELNLHERAHGPHGLVAGTTGSGKSEIVQSYILSLAVNFAPEDVGFLPIDFKGGGMANLFTDLPHLLGSITNLDGAASARALASIRAELQKRQRLFGQFDVNHINGYTRLYKLGKEVTDPAEKAKYPVKPMPHLFLISDEFAELKANQPEFMEELVSTARIGRSLGVHLILATQKPSGVVNDQIWSNSRFKLALKVADVSDSNEIIKTPDAASIVEPGRAYLQVGNNEIYELFQSAWSGATYDPTKTEKHTVDERIYLINDFGQYDLWTRDLSGDEAAQEARKEKVTEISAVVDHIAAVARESRAVLPDKPWLPPLPTRLATPAPGTEPGVPLGLMDIPSRQAQETYRFRIEEASHTALFGSPGYGASTVLQTLVMNLARQKTPEQVQFTLIDLGNNGLLPLARLPHVADIVTLEEDEKFRKMLERIATVLAERKALLRNAGAATLAQYSVKTGDALPLLVNVLDGYDGLSNDKRKDAVDAQLLQLLREGAALGVYLVLSVSRANSIRMNMSSNIPTKLALYMNEESEVATLFGRDRVAQAEILGRGQLLLDQPTAIQFYLPAEGEDDTEVLAALEREINELDASWTGARPATIPMVPQELTPDAFRAYVAGEASRDALFLGLNKSRAIPEKLALFHGKSLAIFTASARQAAAIHPFLMRSIADAVAGEDLVVIDAHDSLQPFFGSADVYVGKSVLKNHADAVKKALSELVENGTQTRRCIVINGMTEVFEKLAVPADLVAELLGVGDENAQLIVMDHLSKVNAGFGMVGPLKENVDQILFGGDLGSQRFVDNVPFAARKQTPGKDVLHSLKDDELSEIVIPTVDEGEG